MEDETRVCMGRKLNGPFAENAGEKRRRAGGARNVSAIGRLAVARAKNRFRGRSAHTRPDRSITFTLGIYTAQGVYLGTMDRMEANPNGPAGMPKPKQALGNLKNKSF